MKTLFALGFGILAQILFSQATIKEPAAFQEVPFEEALKQAKASKKIVFIDFYTSWCGPCKKLDLTTWKDPQVIKLMNEKAVALKLDAEKNRELANRYQVQSYPTMVLIRPDGSVIDKIVGYQDGPTFVNNFKESLVGNTQLKRALEEVDRVKDESIEKIVEARYNLGRELANSNKNAEALTEYLWCLDDGMKKTKSYTGLRSSFLLFYINRLGKVYPPAKDALIERRDNAHKKILSNTATQEDVVDFSSINSQLKEDELSLECFDRLSKENPLKKNFGMSLFPLLVEKKRYSDACVVHPYEKFKLLRNDSLEEIRKMESTPVDKMVLHKIKDYIIKDSATYIEVLAGMEISKMLRHLLKIC